MSWFDAAGFASIAKTALKEAQRTIDKALDINDELGNTDAPSAPMIVDTNSDDFFGAWGLAKTGKIKSSDGSNQIVTTTPVKSTNMTTSLWGSFTGSFFEPPKENKQGPRFSVDSLDDSLDLGDEGFSRSKLVVQHSDDGEAGIFSRLSSVESEETNLDSNVAKKTEDQTNRLSVISNDGKTSSESVEIVSGGTGCTTSPETESSLKISESVEVLPDSLTSPSSIEVLLTETDNTDEYVSPLVSPIIEEIASPDSVEVIVEDQDEDSISFASISDSTSTTLLETNLIIKQPSRTNNMHLPLTPLIDTQPLGNKENIASMIECSNVIDIPNLSDVQNDDDGSQSDRTIIAGDSVMESSSDTSTTTESFYLKNMIADAMTEKSSFKTVPDIPPRETSSPLSSESRSDMVKIGSGHTSGDENETTTSSDIEIISSPNGDSSSTQSRQSPAKLALKQKLGDSHVDVLSKMAFKKNKGHNRELSETSSISDDSHSSEIDRLIKRISEMTEILELREAKLIEFNRHNADLQEVNDDLQHQLNIFLTKQMESADLSQVTEEYTQRLSVLEKKFQQAIREKDNLKKQLEQTKQEAATRMSKSEIDSIINEKDEIIAELRGEGEKLSKQQLQHSNIIKKLRAKEKEQETIIKNLRENVEDLTLETERLKRSLAAKEEVERTQIEAVHKLTSKNKKLEFDINQLQDQVDDVTQKYDTVKKSLDAAKKELIDKNKASSELHVRDQMLHTLESEKRITDSQNEEIINQLEDLRFKLQQGEYEYLKKEQTIRMENGELLRRLESAERRNEELAQSVTDISKPLVRQLDALQATHNTKLTTFEKIEQELLVKIGEMQSKLQLASEAERLSREECLTMRSRVSTLETQLSTLKHQSEIMQMDVEQKKAEKLLSEQELKHEIDALKQQILIENEENENLAKKIKAVEQQLSIEKAAVEAEKRKNSNLQEQIRERTDSLPALDQSSPPLTRNTSPTVSLGHMSISESLGSSAWLADEQFEYAAPRFTNMLELQMLQTNLKQREGEVQQLQWELNRREQEKNLLNSEISELLQQVEQLELKTNEYETVKTQFDAVQQQYETLCQLYGEKVEETEELKLDLIDVKDLYKAQLDEILKLKSNS